MKKKIAIAVIVVTVAAGIAAAILLLPASLLKIEKPAIYIAVAGPMSGKYKENGEDMLKGAQMYLDEIRASGKLKDMTIELVAFNDRDKRSAIKIATQIADEKKVMLVLGHFDSSSALAAGNIYKKSGVPAITASATADNEIFTSANDWYFRIIVGSSFMRNFILNYINKELGVKLVSVIFDKGDFGSSLSKNFENEAGKLEIKINRKWEVESEGSNPIKEVYTIVGDLTSISDPGSIFCGGPEVYLAQIFAFLRYPGTSYTVIGADTFSTPSFITQFNNFPLEKKTPGYFSDGIYGTANFLAYIADHETALRFRQNFITKYGKEPSWVAACYYDAMKLAAEAIGKAELQFGDIREDRRRVKETIIRFDNPDIAVHGVMGDIYFNSDGNNLNAPVAVGFWQNQTFIPAYSQYQCVTGNSSAIPKEQIFTINNREMTRVSVVYAGIDINDIRNIDTDRGIYTIDFSLWFRFSGDFDDTQIEFMNAANPVLLGSPISEETAQNITTRVYRVVADFKDTALKNDLFPFDHHVLSIGFRHSHRNRTQLIYVPDIPGLKMEHAEKKNIGENLVRAIPGWNIGTISFAQSTVDAPGHKGGIVPYSRLRADIQIKRTYTISKLIQLIFPVIGMAILLYLVWFIPADQLRIRAMIIAPILMIAVITHLFNLKYKIIGYSSFCLYALIALSAILSVFGGVMLKKGNAAKAQMISRIGKTLHPGLVILTFLLIGYLFLFRI